MALFNREKFFKYVLDTYLSGEGSFTQGQVYRILWELCNNSLLFHLDDNPYMVGHYSHNDPDLWVPTFTEYEASILSTVVPAMFGIETLPDYEGDPHRVCVEILRDYRVAESTERTLPRWGFTFDDDPDSVYFAFTEPRTWNGWGCPLLSLTEITNLLKELGYPFEVKEILADNPQFNRHAVTVKGGDGYLYEPDECIRIEGEFVISRNGVRYCVYATVNLGLCFNVVDCVEMNPDDWEGYL